MYQIAIKYEISGKLWWGAKMFYSKEDKGHYIFMGGAKNGVLKETSIVARSDAMEDFKIGK